MSEEGSVSSENVSTTESKTDGNKDDSTQSSFSLARAETLAVKRSKLLVLAVIAIAAAVMGALVWFLIDNEEIQSFNAEFGTYAHEIAELVHYEAYSMFTAIAAMEKAITSMSIATEQQWHNVTVPDFEIRGYKNNQLSKALQVSFAPLVNDRASWEAYANANQGWLEESLEMQAALQAVENGESARRALQEGSVPKIPSEVYRFSNGMVGDKQIGYESDIYFGPGLYAPIWQQSPAPKDPSIINWDIFSDPVFQRIYHGMWETRLPVLSEVLNLDFLYGGAVKDDSEHPHSFLLHPVYKELMAGLHEKDDVTGVLIAVMSWDNYLSNLLIEGTNGIIVVLHDTCGDHFTYQIDGPSAIFLGEGDLHDPTFSDMIYATEFAPFLHHNFSDTKEHCEYDLRIFPSGTLEAQFRTNRPFIYMAVVVAVFLVTALVFVLYDWLVTVRQNKVMATAKRTNAIVSSLFPKNVRDRIMQEAQEQAEQDLQNQKGSIFRAGAKTKLKMFLDEDIAEQDQTKTFDSKPIADLFPEVTILFADIVGFTAWSSVREPAQVFTLLETLFAAFDEVATKRRVFKVETVGDCYVAVAGLPDPRKDHATVMARFAKDVLMTMNNLTKKLEVTLGPDTGDLSLRIGLHSGQVTAGVLRGDKSRFQLFGDAMNTASRIESNGQRNRIHLSQETADLLIAAGKSHWVEAREDRISAKGKGELQTYWLTVKQQSCASRASSDDASTSVVENENDTAWVEEGLRSPAMASVDEKTARLVGWNCDVITRLLKQIAARRQAKEAQEVDLSKVQNDIKTDGSTVLDEVVEIIRLPEFDAVAAKSQAENLNSVELDKNAEAQLFDYLIAIASMYRDNPFHNFEHASHVTMSVVKLLGRIVAPEIEVDDGGHQNIESRLHDHTYGITSDPLTQLACVFAAIIHDVDHTGVPNAQLVKEQAAVAAAYKGKSVAEQNSVDIAWELLMDEAHADLCKAIFSTEEEKKRFRQLVVNSVMATDIVDKELKALRNARWEKAFNEQDLVESSKDTVDRKATIVIEHLIQASDVSHTMQHWHIYRKWNERLFHEMYKAYKEGRAEKDPAEFWYKGEIGFFDFYIIPLAKKLKDCGVFGVSSDEYLNYATKNRQEWERRGEEAVAAMVNKYEKAYSDYVPPTEEQRRTSLRATPAEAARVMRTVQEEDEAASESLGEDVQRATGASTTRKDMQFL